MPRYDSDGYEILDDPNDKLNYVDPQLLPDGTYDRPANPHYGQPGGYDSPYLGNPPGMDFDQATGTYHPAPPPPRIPEEPPPRTPPAPPSGGGGGGGGESNPYMASEPIAFDWPQFNAPVFDPGPAFQAPPAFSYDPFSAPTLEQAQNEPGYAFAREEGRKALENSAAARGVLRTGGTLKDILGWGNRFAEQNYGNVFNRAATTYDRNRNNAAQNYQTNYGVSKDVFDTNYGQRKDKFAFDYQGAYDTFQPQQRRAELTFSDLYNRWRDMLNSTTQIATAGAGA